MRYVKAGAAIVEKNSPTLRLLSREDCHLCEIVQRDLDMLGLRYEMVDVDSDVGLEQLYGDSIPVLLYGDREIARAPIERKDLQKALGRLKLTGAKR
jgi:hypothetical protein